MCVQDAESREYYQMFDTRWEDMKKYKKEFLKVVTTPIKLTKTEECRKMHSRSKLHRQ